MTASPLPDPLYAYVGAFVDELWRAGVRHVVICPGSRSTPLAMSFAARQDDVRLWMHVDERSAAYFALGLAKRSRQPVALACSSGTAAANFFPAVVEAHLARIPLIVLTADRPPELRDNGAPQTIDQIRLYGTHVKWFAEIALPEGTPAALRYIRAQAARAVATATARPAGPIHLNMPFREPLVPERGQEHERHEADLLSAHPRVVDAHLSLIDMPTIERLAEKMVAAQRSIIIAGPSLSGAPFEKLLELAWAFGYPILADPLSGLRRRSAAQIITSYDAFLRDPGFVRSAEPEIILRFGAMPTSKPLLQYIQRYPDCPLVVISEENTWEEPTQLADEILRGSPAQICEELKGMMSWTDADKTESNAPPSAWLTMWQQADSATQEALSAGIADFPDVFEGRVFTELAEMLPERATLFVGNSMPVRDCDTFFWGAPGVSVMGNRGANGIDGVISTALGVSAANGEAPTVLVIGDLSFYHDMNGLLAAKLHGLNLTIVLVNNDGGGIFSFLPQADFPEHFEQLFGTPIGLDVRPAVEMYGGHYTLATDWAIFRDAVQAGINEGGLHVVEVRTDRARNVAQHRVLWQRVHAALSEHGVVQKENESSDR